MKALRTALLAAALGAAADAQAQPGPIRIGWVHSGTEAMGRPYVEVMRASLRRLGHVEGRTFSLDLHYVEGRFERYPDVLAGVLKGGAGVIVVGGYQGALAAKNATANVPVVGIGCGIELLIESLARPGGNLTGISCQSQELSSKQLQILREALPQVRRIALLYHAGAPYTAPVLRNLRSLEGATAPMVEVPFWAVGDLQPALAQARQAGADAVFVVPDLLVFANRNALLGMLRDARFPTMTNFSDLADAGSMLSYGADVRALIERAAWYVDRIAKGARPADLPMEQPTRFELVINLKTAKALGITIPPSLLVRADRVIQ